MYPHFEGYFFVLPLVPMVHDPLTLLCPEHPVIALMSGLWLAKSRQIPAQPGKGIELGRESTRCMGRKLYFPLKKT